MSLLGGKGLINTCKDLVQVMEMGNELHSTLSQCTGQVYLMQTDLPAIIAMSEKNYQLNYSESYTGNLLNSDSIIEGYQYSIPIDSAFESLLSQNYSSFILTIGCIGVGIYHTDNGSYKIFDSHARDEYGRSQGTCVLLEVPSINRGVARGGFQGFRNAPSRAKEPPPPPPPRLSYF